MAKEGNLIKGPEAKTERKRKGKVSGQKDERINYLKVKEMSFGGLEENVRIGGFAMINKMELLGKSYESS